MPRPEFHDYDDLSHNDLLETFINECLSDGIQDWDIEATILNRMSMCRIQLHENCRDLSIRDIDYLHDFITAIYENHDSIQQQKNDILKAMSC